MGFWGEEIITDVFLIDYSPLLLVPPEKASLYLNRSFFLNGGHQQTVL